MEEHESREFVHYAWQRDGLWGTGTLTDWADAWEDEYYSGVFLSRTVLTWDSGALAPETHQVMVTREEVCGDDIPFKISVKGTGEMLRRYISALT